MKNPYRRSNLIPLWLFAVGICFGVGAGAQDIVDDDVLVVPEGHRPQIVTKAADIVKNVLARFSDANPEEVMELIQEQFPLRMREFKALSDKHAGEAVEYFVELVDEAKCLLDARRRSPELFRQLVRQRQLDRTIDDLVEGCSGLGGKEREERLSELRRALKEAFEVRQNFLRADLAQMEKDVETLRTVFSKREEKRDEIVERRLLELTGEAQYLEW
jgi:hypothetical protein